MVGRKVEAQSATKTIGSLIVLLLTFSFFNITASLVNSQTLADESYPIIQITNNPSNQTQPAVFGDKIVYQDSRNIRNDEGNSSNEDIYLYDLSTNTERQITKNKSMQSHPAIYGDKIVWQDYRNEKSDIYVYDLTTNTERRITKNNYSNWRPAIYGDKVVWVAFMGGKYSLNLYDLTLESSRALIERDALIDFPVIYGNKIVWMDYKNNNNDFNSDIYLFDLSTNTERQITKDVSQQSFPAIYENKIVWTDRRDGDIAIYLYDLSTSAERQIAQSDSSLESPSIYANKVVWENWGDEDGINIEEYDLVTNSKKTITKINKSEDAQRIMLQGRNLVWQNKSTGNFDIYQTVLTDSATNQLDNKTSLSLSAKSDSMGSKVISVKKKTKTILKGQLRNSNGKGIAFKKVVLQAKFLKTTNKKIKGKVIRVKKIVWVDLIKIKTDKNGNFSNNVKQCRGSYRATFTGDYNHLRSSSKVIRLASKF